MCITYTIIFYKMKSSAIQVSIKYTLSHFNRSNFVINTNERTFLYI